MSKARPLHVPQPWHRAMGLLLWAPVSMHHNTGGPGTVPLPLSRGDWKGEQCLNKLPEAVPFTTWPSGLVGSALLPLPPPHTHIHILSNPAFLLDWTGTTWGPELMGQPPASGVVSWAWKGGGFPSTRSRAASSHSTSPLLIPGSGSTRHLPAISDHGRNSHIPDLLPQLPLAPEM